MSNNYRNNSRGNNDYGQQRTQGDEPINFTDKTISNLVAMAEEKAKIFNEDNLKTNQIRNFYSAIDKMRIIYRKEKKYESIEMELIMLKPKLAYAAGKQKAVKAHFYPFMTAAITGVEEAEDKDKALSKFFALIESVVGYHKFYGD